MVAILSLFVIVVFSLIINRIASVALQLTGLTREVAQFQARSAFSGAGYTTTEAEQIVNHPVRRRIVMGLMMLGNIGLVSVIGSITVSALTMQQHSDPWRSWTLIVVGGVVMVGLARSRWLDRWMSGVIAKALCRYTELDTRDYANLLHLQDGFGIMEVVVGPGLAGRTVANCGLSSRGIVVLGLQRQRGYEGTPADDETLQEKDCLILYGRIRSIHEATAEHPTLRSTDRRTP